jgi:hypothetical protein
MYTYINTYIYIYIHKYMYVGTIPDGSGDVEIFVPSYEANKVHIFRLTDTDDIAD